MNKDQHSLKGDSLGLVESMVMGVAGTAPAFSIAATTGALLLAVGSHAIASLLYCGLIMFGITLAFFHLNKVNPNAGAAYTWVSDVFHPILGFFAGWSLLVAAAVFMVSGTVPAATATLALISPDNINDPPTVALVAAGWLILVSLIVIKGIKLSSYFQVTLTMLEVGMLAIIIFGVLYQFYSNPIQPFSFSELSVNAFTAETFATGALMSLFFFWGWDVTVNLSEETKDSTDNPGKGAVGAMIIVMILFLSFIVAAQFALTEQQIEESGTNIIFVLAEKIFPRPWSYMAIIAVMLSTIGTLETTILQFTRTMFAKGRDKVLNPRYAILHPRWKTPWFSTLVILFFGLLLLFASAFLPSVNEIIIVSVKAIGFQIAFYYGLTGFACAWHFRHIAIRNFKEFLFVFCWPALSACFMVFIAIYSAMTFDLMTDLIGIGGILVGAIPLALNWKTRGVRK